MEYTSRSVRRVLGTAAVALVAGCSSGGGESGGGGPASSCVFVSSGGSGTDCSPIVGTCNNTGAVGDSNLSSFGVFSAESGGYISTGGTNGADFDGGTNAGMFLTPPTGMMLSDITISTFINQGSTVVESATGPALTITATQADPATSYIGFTTTAPFGGVKMTINTPGLGEFLIYEFCAAAIIR